MIMKTIGITEMHHGSKTCSVGICNSSAVFLVIKHTHTFGGGDVVPSFK